MMKEDVKALWKTCFNDDDDYVEFYFRRRYSNEVNMSIQSGEKTISALQMLPYPMTYCGEIVQTAYISGACTHPDYRGKGVMRELMQQTFTRLWQQNIPVCTLIPAEPWLFDYYRWLGYGPVFKQSKRKVNGEALAPIKKILATHTTLFNDKHYQYLNRKLSERNCCIQHTPEDYKVILEALEVSHDYVYVVLQNDQVSGLAVAWKTNEGITVDLLLAENRACEQALLYHIYEVTKQKEIIILKAPVLKGKMQQPFGMARIIDAQKMLQIYAAAHPEWKSDFGLQDLYLSANTGHYWIRNGLCIKTDHRQTDPAIWLTMSEISQILMSFPYQPYMSLMLNL